MLRDGGVSVVNFWASWCVPCRVEHPQLKDLAEIVPVYGVNYDQEPVAANRFLEELGNPFSAIGMDERMRTKIDWGVVAFPETFIVAADGTITYRFAGAITSSVLQNEILPEIEKARRK